MVTHQHLQYYLTPVDEPERMSRLRAIDRNRIGLGVASCDLGAKSIFTPRSLGHYEGMNEEDVIDTIDWMTIAVASQ